MMPATSPVPGARRVLVVGRHASILARVTALLEGAGYAVGGALTDEDAMRLMASDYDALLIGGGVEADSRRTLRDAFAAARPGRPVIEHYGGPDGLLDHVNRVLR